MKNMAFLIAVIFLLQGCTSLMAVNMANHNEPFPPFQQCDVGSTWWYLALPLTLPFDVVTFIGTAWFLGDMLFPLGDALISNGVDSSSECHRETYEDHYSLKNPAKKPGRNK